MSERSVSLSMTKVGHNLVLTVTDKRDGYRSEGWWIRCGTRATCRETMAVLRPLLKSSARRGLSALIHHGFFFVTLGNGEKRCVFVQNCDRLLQVLWQNRHELDTNNLKERLRRGY